MHIFEVYNFPCPPHLQALVYAPDERESDTVRGRQGQNKCPSQTQRYLIIQALKHFTFLPKSPRSFFFSYSMSKMTTTYFTRWICSQGIVTDVPLPTKITSRLSTQILIRNECLPICRQSPDRCYIIKPTGWLSFVSILQSFFTHLDPTTAFNIFLCIYRTYLSSKQPKSCIN